MLNKIALHVKPFGNHSNWVKKTPQKLIYFLSFPPYSNKKKKEKPQYEKNDNLKEMGGSFLSLSQTSPGFYVSAVQVF